MEDAATALTEDIILTISAFSLGAVLVAMAARRLGHGSAIPLVLVGIALGFLPAGPSMPLHPEVVLVILLAPLVFGEGLSLGYVDLSRVGRQVLVLAVGLVVVGAFAIGAVAALVIPGVPFAVVFAFGAILGPTDAVSVSATAKRAGLPHRLVTILEGESLVNDGAALTLLRVALLAAAAGSVSIGEVTLILLASVVGGVAVGAIGGVALIQLLRRSKDTVAVNGLILIAPFPLYLGAEQLGGSGILSVVVAAIIVGHHHPRHSTASGRLQFGTIWTQMTFVLQSVAFMFIGLEIPNTIRLIPQDEIGLLVTLIPVTWVTMVVIRFAFLGILVRVTRLVGRPDYRNAGNDWMVAAWAGARGPISGLAAFSVPLVLDSGEPFPYRDLLIATTLCVVLITLLLGPTLGPVARWAGATTDDDEQQQADVEVELAAVALDRLRTLAEEDYAQTPSGALAVKGLLLAAGSRRDRASSHVHPAPDTDEPGAVSPVETKRVLVKLQMEMLSAEEAALLRLRDQEGLSDHMMGTILGDIDRRRQGVVS